MDYIIEIILIILFLILSALFSGTEIVYAKVNKYKLEKDIELGDKKSKKALDLANDFDKTITTVLVCNNLVNIALTSVATLLATQIYATNSGLSELSTLWSLIVTFIITFIVLLFGEVLPKTIFPHFSYSLSRKLPPFVNFLSIIFYPIIFIFNGVVILLAKPFVRKVDSDDDQEEILDDELTAMTNELEETGKIDEDDAELIKSAISFTDKTAQDIMIPRVDVIAYNIDDGFDNIIHDELFFENSRVPLYKETIDNVIGIIDTTKVLKYMLNKIDFEESDVLYEPLLVHKTMPLSNILTSLKENHIHLAIVLDEWGGFMGILTIEDILEELFGEIWDETDIAENEYEMIDDNHYIVDGDMNISDFFELIDYDDRDFESEYSTLGGWCTEILNKFPEAGDNFTYDNLVLKIIETDGIRVEKVDVIILEQEDIDE